MWAYSCAPAVVSTSLPVLVRDGTSVERRRENGVSSQNLKASDVIWAFLSTHARR